MITTGDSMETLQEPLLGIASRDVGTANTRRRISKGCNSKFAMVCIMVAVVLERLAYYSLLGNIVVFCNTVLGYSPEAALAVNLTFTGCTWLTCLLGGYFGDVVFGRMNTIAFGLIVYFTGFLCLPFLSWVVDNQDTDGTSPTNIIWFVIALSLVSLGEGCFKSNMSPFGADQQASYSSIEHLDKFFSYFYWAINLGSLLGFGPVVYLQDRKGFIYGYSLPAGLLLVALFVFMLPRSRGYIINKPTPNVTVRVYNILKEARNRRREARNLHVASPTEYTGSGCYEDYVPIKHWLDRAMAKYGGTYLEIEVEEVKVLLKIIPVFCFLVVYCMLYYQVNSTFILQGMHMRIALDKFSIPVAWLGLANVIFVLVLVPIIRNGLFPCLEKYKVTLTNAGKMSVGMFIASLSLIAAGVVENYRINEQFKVNNTISKSTVTGCDISIFWQIPQFGLMGLSEIFVLITGLEFAYCQAPKKMQAIVTGLFFIANGIGSMLASLILEFISLGFRNKFIYQENVDRKHKLIGDLKGNLRYFFFGLAALNLINLLFFRRYVTKSRARKDNESLQTVHEYIRSAAIHSTPKVS